MLKFCLQEFSKTGALVIYFSLANTYPCTLPLSHCSTHIYEGIFEAKLLNAGSQHRKGDLQRDGRTSYKRIDAAMYTVLPPREKPQTPDMPVVVVMETGYSAAFWR
ncbi:hypothetical protein AVEN_144590-1 [Araneus ventricosus]|uniref:Uncharacterized protein n=1 Tax=Araneus ventricosus TaxID=182803 RepID=A0A4Y2BYB0_ARAVE|nr:hypothetical protein AVEN_144590-1 [Araneus ventricosus]